jgi:hypothetical protein
MKVTINCSWVSPQENILADGTVVVLNKYDEKSDYVIDLACLFSPLAAKYPAEKRIFAAGEPSAHMGFNPEMVTKMGTFYKGFILSWHKELKHLSQTRPFRMGSSWVSWGSKPENKIFGIGGIFSGKNHPGLLGYSIRKTILSLEDKISIPSMIYSPKKTWKGTSFEYPFPGKRPSLEFMFHFAIENCSEEGYFTEKIMDCFMTYSVPIYFGDPTIGNVFLLDGIIKLDQNNIANQVNSLTPEVYTSKMAAMTENRQRAERYRHLEDNIVQTIKEVRA